MFYFRLTIFFTLVGLAFFFFSREPVSSSYSSSSFNGDNPLERATHQTTSPSNISENIVVEVDNPLVASANIFFNKKITELEKKIETEKKHLSILRASGGSDEDINALRVTVDSLVLDLTELKINKDARIMYLRNNGD